MPSRSTSSRAFSSTFSRLSPGLSPPPAPASFIICPSRPFLFRTLYDTLLVQRTKPPAGTERDAMKAQERTQRQGTGTVEDMRAMVRDTYGAPDVLRLERVPRPVVEGNDVLVRVRAAGVDRGVWHMMTGLPHLGRLAFGLRKPKGRVLGLDLAGTVEAVGPGVTRFAVGDAVYGSGSGSYAEYAIAPGAKLAAKPQSLSFEQAAAVPVSAVTALLGLRAGKIS